MTKRSERYVELLMMTDLKIRKSDTARWLVIPTVAMLHAEPRHLDGVDRPTSAEDLTPATINTKSCFVPEVLLAAVVVLKSYKYVPMFCARSKPARVMQLYVYAHLVHLTCLEHTKALQMDNPTSKSPTKYR